MTKLQKLSHAVLKAQVAFEEEKARIKMNQSLGSHEAYTIYYVRETMIRPHYRQSHVALRVKRGTL